MTSVIHARLMHVSHFKMHRLGKTHDKQASASLKSKIMVKLSREILGLVSANKSLTDLQKSPQLLATYNRVAKPNNIPLDKFKNLITAATNKLGAQLKSVSVVKMSHIQEILAASVNLANKAGQIIRDIYESGKLEVVEKTGKNDLQTKADREAQKCIVKSLRTLFPWLHVIAEEELDDYETDNVDLTLDSEVMALAFPEKFVQASKSDLVMWVDPLDGTKEFTEDFLDHATVLIGLSIGGKAIGGVIHEPFRNFKTGIAPRTTWAVEGMGVFGAKSQQSTTGNHIITTTRSHNNPLINATIDLMKPGGVFRVGGAGHKVMQVVDGEADAYVFTCPGTKRWDTCAGEAILSALGGRLTDVHGDNYDYSKDVKVMNSEGVIATVLDHDWYLQRIPDGVKTKLQR